METPTDPIDRMNEAWRRELPGLDPKALEIVGRVIVLAQHLEKSVNASLAQHHLTLGQYDILATLRRNHPRGGLTPTQLLSSIMLSSGGLTSRLNRLEADGLIVRKPDPDDRRGVRVWLTARGRKLIDAATATRFREAEESLPPLDAQEQATLAELLRKWLLAIVEASNTQERV